MTYYHIIPIVTTIAILLLLSSISCQKVLTSVLICQADNSSQVTWVFYKKFGTYYLSHHSRGNLDSLSPINPSKKLTSLNVRQSGTVLHDIHILYKWGKCYRGSLITVILAIPGFIKNSKYFDYRDFLRIICRNTAILIIEDWEFFSIIGNFFSA